MYFPLGSTHSGMWAMRESSLIKGGRRTFLSPLGKGREQEGMRYRACRLRKGFAAVTTGTWPGAPMDPRGLSPETTGSKGAAAKYSILAAWDSDVIPQTSF